MGNSPHPVDSGRSTPERSTLPECTKQNIFRAIKEVSFKHMPYLQVQLGISTTQMSEIDKSCSGGDDDMKDMTIDAWFQQDQSPSWEKLIEALEKSNENVLAKKIKDRIESTYDMPPLQLIKGDSQDSGSLPPLPPAPPPPPPPDYLPRARIKSTIGKKTFV